MIFIRSAVSLLNTVQQIVTSTIGSNIGLNNIIQQLVINLDNIEIILDKTKPSGGIDDLNIRTAGITNVSTNLIMDTIKQVAEVDTATANISIIPIITTTVTTFKPNQKIHISIGGVSRPMNNTVVNLLSQSRPRVNAVVSFNNMVVGTINLSQSNNNRATTAGNTDSWAFLGISAARSEVLNLATVGTYTILVEAGHSGNFAQQSRVADVYLTYFLN